MIVYICSVRDGISPSRERWGGNFTSGPIPDNFGVISFFLILVLYCPQYVIYDIHNMKVFNIFLKIDYIITCGKGKSQTVRAQSLLMNLSKRFFDLLNFYEAMTFLEKITIMDCNNGLYDLHHDVKNDLHNRTK